MLRGERNSILKFSNKELKTSKFITNLNDGEVLIRLKDKRYIVMQSIDLNFTK
jgi:hypothetical protein